MIFNSAQNTTIKRVFLFEPCLGKMTGHWESNARRFRDEFLKRGIEMKVFCQTDPNPEILEQYDAIPVFATNPFNPMPDQAAFDTEYEKFSADFNKINKDLFQKGDLLLFCTVLPQTHKAAMEWLHPIIKKSGPKAGFIFMIAPNDFPADVNSRKYRLFTKLTRFQFLRKRLLKRLYTWPGCAHIDFYKNYIHQFNDKNEQTGYYYFGGSEEYRMNFEQIFGTPTRLLPFPTISHTLDNVKAREPSKSGKIRIGYFGHSSLEKGGQFLEHIINATTAKCNNVEFHLHINPNIHTEEILAKLTSVTRPNVTFYKGHRSYQELIDLMHSVDINLLPYSPVKYAGAPSMVFTEAVNAGNVLVAPNYTWLSREAEKIGAGYCLFNDYNQESIANALIKAVHKFKRLKQKMPRAKKLFLREHNITRYMDSILKAVSA